MGRRKPKAKVPLKKTSRLSVVWKNFVPTTALGCHVVHGNAEWVIESIPFCAEDWGDAAAIPDLSLDPEEFLLTAINTSNVHKSYFISFPYKGIGHREQILQMGNCCTEDGKDRQITTLVLVLEPLQVIDICYLEIEDDSKEIELYSDIKELPTDWKLSLLQEETPSNIMELKAGPYLFPVGGEKKIFCSQGNKGGFTHFYPQTMYAVDLECDIGTPILAVADGVVREVNQENTVSGIHVNNLFKWNSIMLELDDGNYVEYVHIQPRSALVAVGDKVTRGMEICKVGNIGFCPSPHLHIQFHNTNEKDAPTIPFSFLGNEGIPFCPVAGKEYSPPLLK